MTHHHQLPWIAIITIILVSDHTVAFPSGNSDIISQFLISLRSSSDFQPKTCLPGKEQCILYSKCQYAMNNLLRDNSTEGYERLANTVCKIDYDKREIRLCCPVQDTGLRSNVCGKSNGGRITGGIKASKGEFPWLVALGELNQNNFHYVCGGSLVGQRSVITVAHCFRNTEYTITHARLGDHDITSSSDNVTPLDFRIINKVHPGYRPDTKENDLMVLTLEKDAPYTDFIRPICLPEDLPKPLPFDKHALLEVVGRGRTENSEKSPIPLKGYVREVSTSVCHDAFLRSKPPQPVIDQKNICVGRTEVDVCNGDSGGPLQYKQNNINYLIGVVSFGSMDCNKGVPSVYVRISYYLDWILQHVV